MKLGLSELVENWGTEKVCVQVVHTESMEVGTLQIGLDAWSFHGPLIQQDLHIRGPSLFLQLCPYSCSCPSILLRCLVALGIGIHLNS